MLVLYTVSPSSRSICQTVQHKQNLPDVKSTQLRTRHDQVGNLDRLRTEKERFAPILCRLWKAKRRSRKRLSPTPLNGRVHQLVGRSEQLLTLTSKFLLLACGKQWTRPQKIGASRYYVLYQLLRIPCTMKKALTTFGRAIENVLLYERRKLAFVYVNDIGVFFKTIKQHLHHLQRVLTLLQNASVKIN